MQSNCWLVSINFEANYLLVFWNSLILSGAFTEQRSSLLGETSNNAMMLIPACKKVSLTLQKRID